METTNQKPITDNTKLEQKEHKYSTKENYQTQGKKLKEEEGKKKRQELYKQPENR